MADMITRCPNCATAFRISDAVLLSAKGMVRCGSCLTVFNAKQFLETPPKKASPTGIRTEPPLPRDQDTGAFESLSYVQKPASDFPVEERPLTRAPRDFPTQFGLSKSPSSLFERDMTRPTAKEEEKDLVDEDESWALDLLNEEDDEPVQIKKISEPTKVEFPAAAEEDPSLHDIDGLLELPGEPPKELAPGTLEEDLPPLDAQGNPLDADNVKASSPSEIALRESAETVTETTAETAVETTVEHLATNERARVEHAESPVASSQDIHDHPSRDAFPANSTSATNADSTDLSTEKSPEQSVSLVDHDNIVQQEVLEQPTTENKVSEQEISGEQESPNEPLKRSPPEKASVAKDKAQAEQGRATISAKPEVTQRPRPVEKYNARQAQNAKTERSIKNVLANIEPDPLEVSWEDDAKIWRRRTLWSVLSLVALLILVLQIAWLQFHRLNRIEPYRSFYTVACEFVGCQLPELIDRNQISTSNLLVRSHPTEQEALMVDVILQNDAQFEQPFPALLLRFSDLQNRPVAARKLTPDEYLGGELSGRKLMPVNQPIHIAVEIVDPGREAVSYSIAIVD